MDYTYSEHELELLAKVDEMQKSEGLSQKKVAERLGITDGTLSQLRNKKYNANPHKIFDILENYFGAKEEAKLTYTEVSYAHTSISTEIYDIIRVCQVKGGLAVACGSAGIGKTKAAQQFVKEHKTHSVLITVNPCLTAIKSLLKVIAVSIGATVEKSRDELWFSIAETLSDGMILIFDEAQHLPPKTIEVLRSFSDFFADKGQTLGICFVGNLETVDRYSGKKAEFAQIANRTKQKKVYTQEEIRRDDITKLFPILAAEKKEQEIDLLWSVSRTPQALRGAINLFSNAYDNEDYSYQGLIAMMKFMDMQI
ncbi:MAG: AAA family ATPase [Oscillospiraceae bacterium]|nr:AAA family ATPase [Oscillospiraceae bacterium]